MKSQHPHFRSKNAPLKQRVRPQILYFIGEQTPTQRHYGPLQGLDQIARVLKDTVFVHIPRLDRVLADGTGAEQLFDLALAPRPEIADRNIAVDAQLHAGVGTAAVPCGAVAADEVVERVEHVRSGPPAYFP